MSPFQLVRHCQGQGTRWHWKDCSSLLLCFLRANHTTQASRQTLPLLAAACSVPSRRLATQALLHLARCPPSDGLCTGEGTVALHSQVKSICLVLIRAMSGKALETEPQSCHRSGRAESVQGPPKLLAVSEQWSAHCDPRDNRVCLQRADTQSGISRRMRTAGLKHLQILVFELQTGERFQDSCVCLPELVSGIFG